MAVERTDDRREGTGPEMGQKDVDEQRALKRIEGQTGGLGEGRGQWRGQRAMEGAEVNRGDKGP